MENDEEFSAYQLVTRFLGEEIVDSERASKMERYERGDSAFAFYAGLDVSVEYKVEARQRRSRHDLPLRHATVTDRSRRRSTSREKRTRKAWPARISSATSR